MDRRRQQIERQIAELTENLSLFEVRKSEYVQATDIPLQLIKEEADTRARLESLQRELAALPVAGPEPAGPEPAGPEPAGPGPTAPGRTEPATTTPVPTEQARQRWPLLGLLSGGLLLVVAVGAWLVMSGAMARPPADPTLLDTPTGTVTEAAMQAATAPVPTTSSGQATATSSADFPPLPDYAPALTTTVFLLHSPGCVAEQDALSKMISEVAGDLEPPVAVGSAPEKAWAAEGPVADGPVADGPVADAAVADMRTAARSFGAQSGADLVIWCSDEEAGVTLHFEMLTQRASPEVYEPPTLSLPALPRPWLQRTALGVVNYMRRDYAGAESTLRTAVAMSPAVERMPEVTATLAFLAGNAQIFQRDYAAAAATYEGVAAAQPDWAFAWHNLGVAEFYAAWDSHDFDAALAALAKARDIDPTFDLPLIAEARLYRLIADEVPGSYEKAVVACEQALASPDSRTAAQALVCMNLLQFVGRSLQMIPGELIFSNIDALQEAANPYWAEPLLVAGSVETAYWSDHQDAAARKQAHTFFVNYLREAFDDVHFEESRWHYQDTLEYYLPMVSK